MSGEVERLHSVLATNESLRNEIQEAAKAYQGNKNDDRAVFGAVVAPTAKTAGIEITYDEACQAMLDGRELTDEELEAVAGGTGMVWRTLVSGALAATMVFSTMPSKAIAEELNVSQDAPIEVVDETSKSDESMQAVDDAQAGDQQDDAAHKATPELTAYIARGNNGKGYQLTSNGGARVNLSVRIDSTGGQVDLSKAILAFANSNVSISDETVSPDASNQAELTVANLNADELATLKAEWRVDDTNEFMNAYVSQLANLMAQGVSVQGGISNRSGIELPADTTVQTTAINLASFGMASAPDEQMLVAQNENGGEDEARAKRVSETCKYAAQILNLIGSFATSIATETPGATIQGMGAFLGFIAQALAPTGWTTQDVMNAVLALDSKMDGMSAQLGEISSQLQKLETSVDYKTQVGKITELCNKAMAYYPWTTQCTQTIKDEPDRDIYKVGDPASSKTGTALESLREQTIKQSQLTGEGLSTFNVASDLADAIIGNSTTQLTGAARSFFDYTASCVNWEPETYYARQAFIAYVGDAFINAYNAAMNELAWQIAEAKTDNERLVLCQNRKNLADKATAVANLIGEEGELIPNTTDRADGKVLCTVNGRLYAKSSDGLATIYAPIRTLDQSDFTSSFNDLLTERDEDLDSTPACTNTMSRANFETMAEREAYVRTVPNYSDVTSIRKELELVGLLPYDFSYPVPSSESYNSGNDCATASPHDYNSIAWVRPKSIGYAMCGEVTQTSKSDAASQYHKRTYSADAFDIDNNRAVGKQELYDYNVRYLVFPARWQVDLTVMPMFEMHASD